MDELQKIRAALVVMEKHTSLRQVAIQSGINYITLRNIKSGKSGRVTESVAARFVKFQEKFTASPASVASPRGGSTKAAAPKAAAPKAAAPKAAAPKAAAPKAVAPKKTGPKPKAASAAMPTAAPKKPGPAPKPAVAKRKPGRPAKAKPAAPKAAAVPAPAPAPVPAAMPEIGVSLLGGTLNKEIQMAEARLDFLKKLQQLEADFLKKIGK